MAQWSRGRDKNINLIQSVQMALPKVLIVSRRTIRKDKAVDFVGEYHLDLVVRFGAVPVIVPRTLGIADLLDAYEPFHGLILCEGEDVDPSYFREEDGDEDEYSLDNDTLARIRSSHPSDTAIDPSKDSIEFELVRRCIQRNIPLLGICRGCQVINVSSGGSLYMDVEEQLKLCKRDGYGDGFKKQAGEGAVLVKHIDYSNYDGHRHPIKILPNTPLREWFAAEAARGDDLLVNSYHHQGVKRLGTGLLPMAFAPDGLCEAFYHENYDPSSGHFRVGLQFHPERMVRPDGEYDYVGCPKAYESFGTAVRAYYRALNAGSAVGTTAPPLPAPPDSWRTPLPSLSMPQPSGGERDRHGVLAEPPLTAEDATDLTAISLEETEKERWRVIERGFCEAADFYKRKRGADSQLLRRAMSSNFVECAADFLVAASPPEATNGFGFASAASAATDGRPPATATVVPLRLQRLHRARSDNLPLNGTESGSGRRVAGRLAGAAPPPLLPPPPLPWAPVTLLMPLSDAARVSELLSQVEQTLPQRLPPAEAAKLQGQLQRLLVLVGEAGGEESVETNGGPY